MMMVVLEVANRVMMVGSDCVVIDCVVIDYNWWPLLGHAHTLEQMERRGDYVTEVVDMISWKPHATE